jgi:hypothetical protein
MSHTRAELDRKLARLESRAMELTPRMITRRYMPEYFVDQVIGGILTLVGIRLAWTMHRRRAHRRQALRASMGGYAP